MPTLVAYHGSAATKRKYVRRVEAHRKADELVQGTGWESNGVTRGCAIGCCFNAYDHSRGPIEIGVPEVLMRLEDSIFEGLPKKDAMEWPTRFLKAINTGSDLSLVWPSFAVWMLTDPKHGVIRFAGDRADVRECITRVAALWQRVIDGESAESIKGEFESAARSALSAAWSAWSAWSAALSAESAARSAWSAWSAALSAESAARSVHWRACAGKCIELIKSCPQALAS